MTGTVLPAGVKNKRKKIILGHNRLIASLPKDALSPVSGDVEENGDKPSL